MCSMRNPSRLGRISRPMLRNYSRTPRVAGIVRDYARAPFNAINRKENARMGYKQNLRTIRSGGRRVELMISKGSFEEAREHLREVVGAAMLLTVELHTMEIQDRVVKYYNQSFAAPPEESKEKELVREPAAPKASRRRIKKRDQNVIAEMTRAGSSMREIGRAINRSPSLIWSWQQKLGIKKGKP